LKAGATDQGAGDYAVITREDGSKQWTYKGKPLYYWAKDSKRGDTDGDGVKGVWHTAKP
jgi:predicted lipoprotein with Yx(FWY)xxD motif